MISSDETPEDSLKIVPEIYIVPKNLAKLPGASSHQHQHRKNIKFISVCNQL
jgi:hypothetical protein